MISDLKNYLKSNDIKDNCISISILLMPFALCMSIFISEILVILINITFLVILYKEKDLFIKLKKIQYQILLPILLYILILLSLFFSDFFAKSFKASFFYFRYIIFALALYYLLSKNKDFIKYFFTSTIILSIFIFFDAIYELLQINNVFGLMLEDYRIKNGQTFFLTGFFDDEKKLGSFLIRLLPFMVSIIYFLKYEKKYMFLLILIFGSIIFLSSERVALFLFIIFFTLLIKLIPNKTYFLSLIFIVIFSLTLLQQSLAKKYIMGTLFQLNITKNTMSSDWSKLQFFDLKDIKYFSSEHENLIKSGIQIFKKNPLIGSGVKTFYDSCNKIKKEEYKDLTCSTHPHNTYIQLLSDTGILSLFIVAFIFIYIFYINVKIFFKKKINNYLASFYVLNIGILLNLMPLIPSGSIYNNWINIMIYYPIGLWFYLFSKLNKMRQ